MKRGMILLLAALSMAALMASGCANKETVKAEEPAPATVKAETPKVEAQPETPTPPAEPVKPAAEAPKEEAQPTAAPVEATLETAYFDFDKAELRQDTREVLSKNAEFLLKVKPETKIRIEGNCDERGSAEYNLALGERRAKSVLQYLLTLGVNADRMSVISYGKEKPAVQGSNEEAWAKNRRADFVIIK